MAVITLGVTGCVSTPKRMNVAAPKPPVTNLQTASAVDFAAIQPAAGSPHSMPMPTVHTAMHARENTETSCAFSSFHRKNTVGYELDSARHISFTASPSFDIWDASDFDMKVGIRFTKALGGAANKRPKCTYGSGYYGLLPYLANDDIAISKVLTKDFIQGYLRTCQISFLPSGLHWPLGRSIKRGDVYWDYTRVY